MPVWADLGFRPRNPLEASDGMGELRAHRARTMQPAQPNPQSPLNYAAMLITREYTFKESLHSTQRFSLRSAVFHSPFVISKSETESWEFSKRDAGAMPTIIRGTPSSYNVILISKVLSQHFSILPIARRLIYTLHGSKTLRFEILLLLISIP